MASLNRHDLKRRLNRMGIIVVNYRDPVDGTPTPVLDLQQVAKLIEHYEEVLLDAVQTRPIRIETLARVAQLRQFVTSEEVLSLDAECADRVARKIDKLFGPVTF